MNCSLRSLREHLAKLEEDAGGQSEEKLTLTLPVPNLSSSDSPQDASPGKRRLKAVQSSPMLPVNEISVDKEKGPLRLAAARKKYVGKLQSRNTTISQVMLKRIEQANKPPETNKTEETGDVPGPWKECQAKKASFAQSVFSTESTDSLDFLSDNQPRLTSSMSCGDLSEVERTAIVRSDSISLTEIPQAETTESESKLPQQHKAVGSFNRYTSSSIGNSLSLNSGLSSLQRHKLSLSKSKKGGERPVSEKRRSGLGRLVHPGSRTASRLDINQNGWKKNERKRGEGGGKGEGVVDMKLASKCCTLC